MRDTNNTLRRCQVAALWAAVIGSVGSVWALVSAPDQSWPAYHVSYLFWWQITVGFLALTLLRCIIRSNWGNATWPYLKSSLWTIPLIAVLFVPTALRLSYIFPWAIEESTGRGHANPFQTVYFGRSFFWGRCLGYFAIWLVSGLVAARSGTTTGDARLPRRFSSFALIALVLTSTFAAFDWGMSLEPEWYSTIYGAMVLMSGTVGALAILILYLTLLLRVPRLPLLRLRQVLNDLGNLLLAFLMIWSYFAFSQYLIIWAGNLPAEVTWYLRRSAGSWQAVLLVIVVFHFVVPFFSLLSREQKQNPRRLAAVAMVLLAANLIQSVWTYAPAFADQVTDLHWSLCTSLLAMGGCWFFVYTMALARSLNSEQMMRRNA